jgi:hypothetical protein
MTMENVPTRYRDGERGFALVLAILALMLLTVLGLTLATTTTTELQIATNYRWGQQALYNAEAGIEAGKVILARTADPSLGWLAQLPARRTTPNEWFTNGATPPPTGVGRDYEKQGCDGPGKMGYGRVLMEGTTAYEGVSTFEGRALNGGFTLWLRRPLRTAKNGAFSDATEHTTLILTVEGVAPYAPTTTGASAAFVQANQAVRVLEMPLALNVQKAGDPCRQMGGQEGMGPSGDNFDPCSVLSGASAGSRGSLGDAVGGAPTGTKNR